MENFLRIYIPLFYLAVILITFALPSYLTWKKTGIKPITFGNSDNAYDYIGFAMKLLLALIFGLILIFSLFPIYYQYVLPISYLNLSIFKIAGIVFMHGAMLWIGLAQYQMGISWRIGIDHLNKTTLVDSGLFAISRNPIFLGLLLCLLGLFLLIPSGFLLSVLLTTYFVIQIQVRLEEDFLKLQHDKKYVNYKDKVRRWL